MQQRDFAIVNGVLLPKEEASLPITDLAMLWGYGVFDFFLLARGLPLFFEDHWQRLHHSASAMSIKVPFSREDFLHHISALYEKMPLPFGGIRVTLTGGNSPDGYSLAPEPNSLITLQPLAMFPEALPEKGFALMTHAYRRAMPQVKSIDYAVGIMMQQVAKSKGFDEVLYVQDGVVSECPRANIFAVTNAGILITPDLGILSGITRMRVINLARPHMKVENRPVGLEELFNAKEVFITSTTKGIMPVFKIDDTTIGKGEPGVVSRFLYAGLKAQVDSVFY